MRVLFVKRPRLPRWARCWIGFHEFWHGGVVSRRYGLTAMVLWCSCGAQHRTRLRNRWRLV